MNNEIRRATMMFEDEGAHIGFNSRKRSALKLQKMRGTKHWKSKKKQLAGRAKV